MKVVLLAGGLGTRISEASQFKPKPMIEIGGMPIIWHIMKEFSYYGFNDFIKKDFEIEPDGSKVEVDYYGKYL